MRAATRIVSLILGSLLGYVQLRNISTFRFSNPDDLGRDVAWLFFMGISVVLLLYGIGMYPRTTIIRKN
jgi:hypothetical protein